VKWGITLLHYFSLSFQRYDSIRIAYLMGARTNIFQKADSGRKINLAHLALQNTFGEAIHDCS